MTDWLKKFSKRYVVLLATIIGSFVLTSKINVEADISSASTASSSKSSTTESSSMSSNSTTSSTSSVPSSSTSSSMVIPPSSDSVSSSSSTSGSSTSSTSSTPESSSSSGSSSSSEEKKDESSEEQAAVFVPFTYNEKTKAFIDLIVEDAKTVANANDLYVCVMIAQAILESGSGTSGLASAPNYNLFGIKGTHNGQSVKMSTYEDDGSGNLFEIESDFRKYDSYKESLEDYAKLISQGPGSSVSFYKGAWKSQTLTYQDATKFLTGRYATDTLYNQKLDNLIELYELDQYDPSHTEIKRITHIVQEGETLESIAELYGVTVESIMELNGLTDANIWVGQELLIKEEVIQIINPETQKLIEDKEKQEKYEKIQRMYRAFRSSIDSVELANNLRINGILSSSISSSSTEKSTTSSTKDSSSLQSTTNQSEHTYVVQQGDSLQSISQKTGISIDTLKQINHLTSLEVYEGQTLYFTTISF